MSSNYYKVVTYKEDPPFLGERHGRIRTSFCKFFFFDDEEEASRVKASKRAHHLHMSLKGVGDDPRVILWSTPEGEKLTRVL